MAGKQVTRFAPWIVFVLLAGSGCSLRAPLLPGLIASDNDPAVVELEKVPFFPQEAYQCGPASLASVLSASGVPVDPDAISAKVFLPGRKGSVKPEIMAACRRYGRIPYQVDPEISSIAGEIRQGRPVLVLTNLGLSIFPVWHYAVVVGYDLDRDRLILRSGDNPRESVPARVFLRTWERAGRWGIVALKPGEMPYSPDRVVYLNAAADMEEIGMFAEARKAYQSALQHWPDDPVALFGIGNTSYSMGDLKTAEAAFRRILEKWPDNSAARNNLSIIKETKKP